MFQIFPVLKIVDHESFPLEGVQARYSGSIEIFTVAYVFVPSFSVAGPATVQYGLNRGRPSYDKSLAELITVPALPLTRR